jgi:hypothetical protein
VKQEVNVTSIKDEQTRLLNMGAGADQAPVESGKPASNQVGYS